MKKRFASAVWTLVLILVVSGVNQARPTPARAAIDSALWVSRYGGSRGDEANAVAVSPDGSRVFVTGKSTGPSIKYDYATEAYDAATGAALWSHRYNGPGNADDLAFALVVSPDGSRVFVTGYSGGAGTKSDYATVAYDAGSGATLWVRRYNGPNNAHDLAYSIAVAPDGSRVFVTGSSCECSIADADYATVAYDADTGTRLWVRRYNGSAGQADEAYSVAVSPDGSRVYVTGTSIGGTFVVIEDYATVAYDAATGTPLWVRRYDGPGSQFDLAYSVAVSPDGSGVFVTGYSYSGTDYDYATVAYDAVTGTERWITRYDGPGNDDDIAYSVEASADGARVFVTGTSPGDGTDNDYATVAYDAVVGDELWVSRYDGPGLWPDVAYGVASSPDGSRAFVTGFSRGSSLTYDYATVAYDAASGAAAWVERYDGPGNAGDTARWVTVSPDGSRIFVTGSSGGSLTASDYATVAYAA